MASLTPEAQEIFGAKYDPSDEVWLRVFFTPSKQSQAAGRKYLERQRARKENRDPLSNEKVAPAQIAALQKWGADWAAKNGASWTVLRPHVVMGPSLNSPMNLVTSLATYAAMTRELGLPLRFPGTKEGWNTLQETTDAELFGRATLWALGEDKARNEIFNVSNGDVYRWRQLWNELVAFYDLPIAEPLAMSTVSEMSEKAPLWDSIVARYGLHATPYDQIANWAFVDWMLNFREETILSTIKIRQAGFADCIDTHQSFRRQLTRLRDMRIVP